MPTTPLQPGMSGNAVTQLQQWLISQGYNIPDGPTGYYGDQTKAAVLAFQNAKGVNNTSGPGFWGLKTIAVAGAHGTSDTPAASTQAPSTGGTNTIAPAHIITDPGQMAQFVNPSGALVTIQGQGYTPQQLYMIDPVGKQLIPFSSMNSAINYFSNLAGHPVTADQINATTSQIPAAALNTGSTLSGYQIDGSANGFDENGILANPAPSNSHMDQHYGKPVDDIASQKAVLLLDHFADFLSSGQPLGSNVDPAEVKKLMSDLPTVQFLANAMAYGGYKLSDVYLEMVRQQNIDKGNVSAVANAFPISANQTAAQYKSSTNYQNVLSNPAMTISPTIMGMGTPNSSGGYNLMNTEISMLPDEAFNAISPLTNPNSPEFASQMAQYKSGVLAIGMEMAQATNESSHAKAMADWNTMKTEINDRLGITLSDNAIQAWNQLSNLDQQSSMNNLAGSGIVQQQIDDYLKQQSSVNQSMRSYYQTAQDQQQQAFYQTYASPDQIAALAQSDPAKAQAWGLIPNDSVKQYMTVANLHALFPNEPVGNLQQIINSYLDSNGNLYSGLYSQYKANTNWNPQGSSLTQLGQVDAGTKAMQASQNAAGLSSSQYSNPGNPFLLPSGNGLPETKTTSVPGVAPTSQTGNAALTGLNSSQKSAAQSLGGGSQTTQTPAPITPNRTNTNPNTTSITAPAPTTTATSSSNPFGFTGAQLGAYNNAASLVPKTPASYPNLGSGLSINSSGQMTSSTPTASKPVFNTSTGTFSTPTLTTAPRPTRSSPLLTGGSNTGGGFLSTLGNTIGSVANTVGNWFSGLHF